MRRRILIDHVAVRVVLHDEATGVKPVVEDLRAHDMPPYAPHLLVLLLDQPLVTHHLCVKVLHLVGGVVDLCSRLMRPVMPCDQEAVVIRVLSAEVQVIKGQKLRRRVSGLMEDVRRLEVEVIAVPRTRLGLVIGCIAEVT